MTRKPLNFHLAEALKNGQAIGHFNFATQDVAKSIVEGAKDAGAKAVMLGTSEGEAEFFGLREAVAATKALGEHYDFPVYLNADHFRSFEKCKEAIDAGYDSVIIDPKNESYEEKVLTTKEVVEYAKTKNPDISVEGELGYLKGSSEVQKKIEISPADYTKPEEAKDFVDKTGVHRLAVVFGNFHGIATEQQEHLDVGHFKKIVSSVPEMYFVLHGASGVGDDEVKAAIKAGITNIHFNTELRLAYHDAIQKILSEKPGETTPYKYLAFGAEQVKKIVFHKTRVFMGL
jgi:ketose-bisphosphate aldolase